MRRLVARAGALARPRLARRRPPRPVVPRDAPEEAARVAAVTAPADRLRRAGAVRGAARRGGDLGRAGRRQRLLALVGQHVLRARARLQGRQRLLPQALGDGAVLDAGVGRARAALQRARLPVLPPEGRARRIRRPGRTTRRWGCSCGCRCRRTPADLPPALAGIEDYLATLPEPIYGGQLQNFGVPGLPAEGRMAIAYDGGAGDARRRRGGDAAAAELRRRRSRPTGRCSPDVHALAAGGAADDRARAARGGAGGGHPGAGRSGRRATATGSAGGRTASGREADGRPMLGRFGWKAGQPTIREQSAAAFAGDIGISTTLHPDGWGDCTAAQAACRGAAGRRRAGGGRHGARPRDLLQPQPGGAGAARRRTIRRCCEGKRVFYDGGLRGLPPRRSSSPTGWRTSRSRASS